MVLSFLNSLEINKYGEKDGDEWKSDELKRCLTALHRSWNTGLHGARPLWAGCPEPGSQPGRELPLSFPPATRGAFWQSSPL